MEPGTSIPKSCHPNQHGRKSNTQELKPSPQDAPGTCVSFKRCLWNWSGCHQLVRWWRTATAIPQVWAPYPNPHVPTPYLGYRMAAAAAPGEKGRPGEARALSGKAGG